MKVQLFSSTASALEETFASQRSSRVERDVWKGSCPRDQEMLFTVSSSEE
jgi:hypothetical protein